VGALSIEDLNYTYDDYKNWDGDWKISDDNFDSGIVKTISLYLGKYNE